MSVVIRFARTGKKGERKFRLVVMEKRSKRDGKTIDSLGWYEKRVDKVIADINKEKYSYWIQKGARPSEGVRKALQE